MGIAFKPYSINNKEKCLALFDSNCPEYFAPIERQDYETFLTSDPKGYEICLLENKIIGAFGLHPETIDQARLDWILLSPEVQGSGIGSAVMDQVIRRAKSSGISDVAIATSHKADQFFARKGAQRVSETKHGWGPDMHRVDMLLRLKDYPG